MGNESSHPHADMAVVSSTYSNSMCYLSLSTSAFIS